MDSDLTVTISQVPAGGYGDGDWRRLVDHVDDNDSDFVILPEMPFYRWLPSSDDVVADEWNDSVETHDEWIDRLGDLGDAAVASSRPVTREGRRFNEAFVWDADLGYRAVHHKAYLPDEAGFWEASWYDAGPDEFELVDVAGVSAGFLICTELWAMERAREYGQNGAHILITPRATGAPTERKWLAGGRTAAVVAGAFSLSANRAGPNDAVEFAGKSWCFGPDGDRLAITSADDPNVTVSIDPTEATDAQETYPRYAFK